MSSTDPFGVPDTAPKPAPVPVRNGGPPPKGIPTLGERVVQSWRDWLQRALRPSTEASGDRLVAPSRRPPVTAYGPASVSSSTGGDEWATPSTVSAAGAGADSNRLQQQLQLPNQPQQQQWEDEEDDCYCDFDENVNLLKDYIFGESPERRALRESREAARARSLARANALRKARARAPANVSASRAEEDEMLRVYAEMKQRGFPPGMAPPKGFLAKMEALERRRETEDAEAAVGKGKGGADGE